MLVKKNFPLDILGSDLIYITGGSQKKSEQECKTTVKTDTQGKTSVFMGCEHPEGGYGGIIEYDPKTKRASGEITYRWII